MSYFFFIPSKQKRESAKWLRFTAAQFHLFPGIFLKVTTHPKMQEEFSHFKGGYKKFKHPIKPNKVASEKSRLGLKFFHLLN